MHISIRALLNNKRIIINNSHIDLVLVLVTCMDVDEIRPNGEIRAIALFCDCTLQEVPLNLKISVSCFIFKLSFQDRDFVKPNIFT